MTTMPQPQPQPRNEHDYLDNLAVMLEALDRTTVRDEVKLQRNESNRINLLVVHAIAALIIGPLFSLLNARQLAAPSFAALRHVPGMPLSMGMCMLIGGAVLLPATLARHKVFEAIGLWFISTWYAMMGIGFLVSIIIYLVNDTSVTPPSFYASTVYIHLAVVMVVHIFTLNRLRGRGEPVEYDHE